MLNLYLKQLMEAKKKVFEAMSNGDFSAVQETMEKYKKMEEILQKPIYNRIMNMSNEEFFNLVQALRTKGVSIEETITKKELISKFMNLETITDERNFDFSKRNIILIGCNPSNYSSNSYNQTKVEIGNSEAIGQDAMYEDYVNLSSGVARKLDLSAGSETIDKERARTIIYESKQIISDYRERYKFTEKDFMGYIEFLEILDSKLDDYIDLSSREYRQQTQIFAETPSVSSMNMLCSIEDIRKRLRGTISTTDEQVKSKFEDEQKYTSAISSALDDPEVEKLKKEIEAMCSSLNVNLAVPEMDSSGNRVVRYYSNSLVTYTNLKTIIQEIDEYGKSGKFDGLKILKDNVALRFSLDKFTQLSRLASRYIGLLDTKVTHAIKGNVGYMNFDDAYKTLIALRDFKKSYDFFNEVYECESLEEMKKKAIDRGRTVDAITRETIFDCLKCYVPRKELIRKLSSKVVLLYDSLIKKFGHPSIISNSLFFSKSGAHFSFANACENYNADIDWFSILQSLRNTNIFDIMESDIKGLEKLIHALTKQIENQELFDKMKTENNKYNKGEIGNLPTFGGTFEFESDVEPIADYLAENQKQR